MAIDPRDADRPSQHGAILGEALALMAAFGRKDLHFDLPPMCSTCAFREGCMTNQSAATGKAALNCVLGIDKDRFACHHGMKGGEPTKICVGYVAAKFADFATVKEIVAEAQTSLAAIKDGDADEVRKAFDRWRAEVDPDFRMDAHELARAYEKSPLRRTPIADLERAAPTQKEGA